MRIPILLLLLVTFAVQASTPVRIQGCGVAPTSTEPNALLGCPRTSVTWIAPAPTDLVRAQVKGAQTWAMYSKLLPADSVVIQTDGSWHPLGSITVALPAPPIVPPVTPPVPPPAIITADVVILWDGNPPMGAVFPKLPTDVPQCFKVSSRGQTVTACLPVSP